MTIRELDQLLDGSIDILIDYKGLKTKLDRGSENFQMDTCGDCIINDLFVDLERNIVVTVKTQVLRAK